MTGGVRLTRAEVALRKHLSDAAIIIDNVVYNVTEFVEEHPGGPEVLLRLAGGDASRCFRDVGHSETALRWREQFKIGDLIDADKWEVLQPISLPLESTLSDSDHESGLSGMLNVLGPPLGLALLAVIFYALLF